MSSLIKTGVDIGRTLFTVSLIFDEFLRRPTS